MASREEMRMIRDARAGQSSAQLALGKRYLYGEGTFGKNITTALYWLDRAAEQNEKEAWELIGRHIPLDVVFRAPTPMKLVRWYERAFDDGVMQAGIVLARLVLQHGNSAFDDAMRQKAWRALEKAALSDVVEAQWWLAQCIEAAGAMAPSDIVIRRGADGAVAPECQSGHLAWLERAAENGLLQAQRALSDVAWSTGDQAAFLRWSAPVARAIVHAHSSRDGAAQALRTADATLLFRCGQALSRTDDGDSKEVEQFWKCAAEAGDLDAQFALGLWFAKVNAVGKREADIPTATNYKKAIRWLTAAASQGKADAWYVIAKIHMKPDFRHAEPADAQRFLESAAEAGHLAAQLELARKAWRARYDDEANDVRAVYWLQKAAALGSAEAQALLNRIAAHAIPAPWAEKALHRFDASVDPFLRARIELATFFGLTRAEALLLDVHSADRRHCLLVDIRAELCRSRRRIILISTGEQRRCLTRIGRLFENVDCGPHGPEGNYRQRLYRLQAALDAGQAAE